MAVKSSTETPLWKDKDFLGGVVVPAAGAAISAAQLSKNSKIAQQQVAAQQLEAARAREQAAAVAAATAKADLYTQGQNDQYRRSAAHLEAAPLGWAQNFERQNATREMLAPGLAKLANFRYKTGDAGVDAHIGNVPTTDFDLSRFMGSVGRGATAASIGDRERALQTMMQGQAAPSSLGQILGSPEGMTQDMQSRSLADLLRGEAQQKDQLNQQYVMGALEGNLNQAKEWRAKREEEEARAAKKQEDGGFLKGLGKTLLKVAPVALQFIPGIGTAAGIALAAAANAGSAAASGGGLKGALLGAGAGALGGAAGPLAGKIGGSAVQQALLKSGMNAAAGGISGGAGGAMAQGLGSLAGSYADSKRPAKPFTGVSPTAPYEVAAVPQGQLGVPAPQNAGGFSTPGALGGYQFGGGGNTALDQYIRNQNQKVRTS